jgi:hypothetical protein
VKNKAVFIVITLILTITFSACSNKEDEFLFAVGTYVSDGDIASASTLTLQGENEFILCGPPYVSSATETTDNINSSTETPDAAALIDIKAASPNHELEASIIRKDGMKYDSLLITGQDRADCVLLEDIFYTSVLNLTWIDDSRVALLGHLNPSSNVYVILNSKTLSIDGSYYGLGFTWNKSKDRLYYVATSPHFSGEQGGDKIVDNDGYVYYEADKNTMISDQALSVSEDEKTISFTIRDINTDSEQSITITPSK